MTIIYIYTRVSSASQATSENASTDAQIEQCSAFVRSQYPDVKYVVVTEVFSGRVLSKQIKLNKILSEIQANDILVFYNVSRLTRDSSTGITILAELNRKNVRIHSVAEKLTYSSDRASFRRLFVDANEESDVISDRVRNAISYIRGRNGHVGKTAFGYKTERQSAESGRTYCVRKVVPNPEEMTIVQKIIYYVDNTTDLDDIVNETRVGICNVIADKLNSENKLCRGKKWSQFRVRDIYKTFGKTFGKTQNNVENNNDEYDDGESCEICHSLTSKTDNPIILCDGCDKGFHMKCMKMSKVPTNQFFCSVLCQFKKM